jgi:hypothetical protein
MGRSVPDRVQACVTPIAQLSAENDWSSCRKSAESIPLVRPIRELLTRVSTQYSSFYWNSLPFGELLWILVRILIRIHKNSPNSTEFQRVENGYFSADPSQTQRLSPESGSSGAQDGL